VEAEENARDAFDADNIDNGLESILVLNQSLVENAPNSRKWKRNILT
jgi:hypothetical protein